MKNRTVLILLATLTATILLFTGCGKKADTEPVVSESAETEDVEEVESIEETFKLIGEDIKLDFYKVDYRQVGVMEVTTNAIDTKIYNKMIMFSLNGKFKTISFNCTEELKDEWLDTGDAIIKSLKFN